VDEKYKEVKGFEDLLVWQKAQDLAVKIYKITKNFPDSEKFGIIDQLKRASSSVSANIAEGFGRNTAKDKLQFYSVAYGSTLETKNFVYLANKIGYLDDTTKSSLIEDIVCTQRLLGGFIKSTRKRL
jgi:four helix bundle protein